VQGLPGSRAAQLAALAAALALTAASVALAAPGRPSSTALHGRSGRSQGLDTRLHQALLGLYALDARLHEARVRLGALEDMAAGLRHRRDELRRELTTVRASLRAGQLRLALHLRALYEQGSVDPVAVVLGAASLGDALARLDGLRQVAAESRQIVAATMAARARLLRLRRQAATEERGLVRALAAARQSERTLAQATTSRSAFVAALRERERFRRAQVRQVVATAQAAERKSVRLQTRPKPPAPAVATPAQTPPAAPPPPPPGGRTLVVTATAYSLPGHTATGMPVGWGVVAVDPSVIPLGTRLRVPGYGDGVAADVGSGIRGRMIDLWFPTLAQARAWGRRTVTVTLY
jgi:3D (Asp-Asp-Asp) domain-containing protein